MIKDRIDGCLKDVSFDFFYWFSRFEFALKENGCLKDRSPGSKAEPSWERLKIEGYTASREACRLVEMHPKRQYVTEGGGLRWEPVGIEHCRKDDELCRVITMLRTVRNNLFHGGKHGDEDLDSKERNVELLRCSKVVLDQLADEAGIAGDYKRFY
jgi:hypothetical protein